MRSTMSIPLRRPMSIALRKLSADVCFRTRFLEDVPYRLATADDPAEARVCYNLLVNGKPSRMSPLVLH